MDIGALLKEKRIEKGLTQKDVAAAVGVSEGTVSRWESGKIENMRRDKINALANYLSIDPIIITKAEVEKAASDAGKVAYGAAGIAAAGIGATVGPVVASGIGVAAPLVGVGPLATAILGLLTASAPIMENIRKHGDDKTKEAMPVIVRDEPAKELVSCFRSMSETDRGTLLTLARSLAKKE